MRAAPCGLGRSFVGTSKAAIRTRSPTRTSRPRLLAEHAARACVGFTCVSHLDAQGLIHPDLPGWIAADNNGSGYIAEKGYMLDFVSGRIARMRTAPGESVCWKHCGSCGYFAVDFGRRRFPAFHLRLIGKGHKSYTSGSAARPPAGPGAAPDDDVPGALRGDRSGGGCGDPGGGGKVAEVNYRLLRRWEHTVSHVVKAQSSV